MLVLILEKLKKSELEVKSIIALSGDYLDTYGIMSSHYGVIDSVARDPITEISDQGKGEFVNLSGRPMADSRVMGAFEYLSLHKELSADELGRMWLERGYNKLSGGTYCQFIKDEDLYLFNGFYPRLLENFTRSGSSILAFIVQGDIEWSVARQSLVGATNPEEAMTGSIRAELLQQREALCIEEISPNLNGVHLSAGPVEGLVELRRFTTDYGVAGEKRPITDFQFGRALSAELSDREIESVLGNTSVSVDQERISIFDLTEELDSKEAMELLKWIRSSL